MMSRHCTAGGLGSGQEAQTETSGDRLRNVG